VRIFLTTCPSREHHQRPAGDRAHRSVPARGIDFSKSDSFLASSQRADQVLHLLLACCSRDASITCGSKLAHRPRLGRIREDEIARARDGIDTTA